MKVWTLVLIVFLSCLPLAFSKVDVVSMKKSFSWQNTWNEFLSEELNNYSVLMKQKIDEEDLKVLGCLGFNSVTEAELKKDFWVVFFSSLVRAESAFNPKAKSIAPKGGHGNYGLLQFSKRTARQQCGLNSIEEIENPKAHLKCGVKLLSWQLEGAPRGNGRLLRPDLKEQLFGKHILLWGPLRQNDKKGKALLVNWFKKHRDQLPFCEG